jgi:hypothetical protein
MLLCHGDDHALAEAKREQCHENSTQIVHEIKPKGQHRAASLRTTLTATRVRMRRAKPFVTDGPFAETREQLGG